MSFYTLDLKKIEKKSDYRCIVYIECLLAFIKRQTICMLSSVNLKETFFLLYKFILNDLVISF